MSKDGIMSDSGRQSDPAWFLMSRYPSALLLVGTGLLCGLGAFIAGFGSLSGSVVRWSSFAAVCREGVLLPSLVIGGASFLLGRRFSDTNVVVGRAASRGADRIWLQHGFRLMFAVIVGYTIGLIPVVIGLSFKATWKGADWWALPDTWTVLCFLVVFGMALAVVLHGRWGALVVPMILLLSVIVLYCVNEYALTNTGHSSLLFAPIWGSQSPDLGMKIGWRVHVARIVFYCLLSMLVIRVTLGKLQGRHSRNDVSSWMMAFALVIVLVVSIVFPRNLVSPEAYDYACDVTSSGAKLCLHPADVSVRAQIEPLIDKAVMLTGTQNATYAEYVPGDLAPGQGRTVFTIVFDGSGNIDTEQVVHNLDSQILFTGRQCLQEQRDGNGSDIVLAELDSRVSGKSETTMEDDTRLFSGHLEPGAGFQSMSDKEFTSWLKAHWAEASSCTMKEDALP